MENTSVYKLLEIFTLPCKFTSMKDLPQIHLSHFIDLKSSGKKTKFPPMTESELNPLSRQNKFWYIWKEREKYKNSWRLNKTSTNLNVYFRMFTL